MPGGMIAAGASLRVGWRRQPFASFTGAVHARQRLRSSLSGTVPRAAAMRARLRRVALILPVSIF